MGEAAFGAISFFREREDIALELAKGIGIRAIARKLGRPPSTISREVRRNAATRSGNLDYRPVPPNGTPIVSPAGLLASWRSIRLCVNMLRSAWPAKSPTPMAPHSRAPRWVWKKRQSRRWSATWSPEQIAKSASDRLPRGSNHADQPRDDLSVLVHSRTRSIAPRTDRMSAFRPSVARTARTRVPRERARVRNKSFIGDALIISDRPAEIADRAVPGHWEGDLILGLGS